MSGWCNWVVGVGFFCKSRSGFVLRFDVAVKSLLPEGWFLLKMSRINQVYPDGLSRLPQEADAERGLIDSI